MTAKKAVELAVSDDVPDVPVQLPVKYRARSVLGNTNAGIAPQYMECTLFTTKRMDKSRTDQSYNRSVADMVLEFQIAGKTLSDIRASQYDFPDGVDDGRTLGLARRRNVEFEDVSAYQKEVDASLADNLAKDVSAKEAKEAEAKAESEASVESKPVA